MRYVAALAIIVLSCSGCARENEMTEIPHKNIRLDQLEEMFANIRENTDWDTSGDLLWGYFFTHHEPSKLEEAKVVLANKGYRVVDIYLSEKEDPNEPDMFWLHIEKIETHSPITLDARNDEFYLFAYEFGLDTYDGMDVGPVGQPEN